MSNQTQTSLLDFLPEEESEALQAPAPIKAKKAPKANHPQSESLIERIKRQPPLTQALCREDSGQAPRLSCLHCDGTIEHPIADGLRTVCSLNGLHTAWIHHNLLARGDLYNGVTYGAMEWQPGQQEPQSIGLETAELLGGFHCSFCQGGMRQITEGGPGFRCKANQHHLFWVMGSSGYWKDETPGAKQAPVNHVAVPDLVLRVLGVASE